MPGFFMRAVKPHIEKRGALVTSLPNLNESKAPISGEHQHCEQQ